MLIFEYVKLEVYRIGWPIEEWAGPTHIGHTPTLQMGLLQYKIGGGFRLYSKTVGYDENVTFYRYQIRSFLSPCNWGIIWKNLLFKNASDCY